MSDREWRTVSLLERLGRGELTTAEVAASLERSTRQVQRIRNRVRQLGAAGVRHGNAGRAPTHKTCSEIRARVVALRQGKYAGFNDQHFTEKLSEAEDIKLSRETVRRFLRAEGVSSPRRRRPPKHRQRRPRRAQAGQMVLWDGSSHDWLEGRGPSLCLMGAIDDATGELLEGAHFTEQETTVGYLRVLRGLLVQKGIPHTMYQDRHSSLKRNDKHWTLEEELAGRQDPTQVGMALREMGVGVIFALSAQAKGRVERLWGTLQDRLVSELRLANARTRGQANSVLNAYIKEHNKRFAIAPQDSQSAWRKAPKDHIDLLELCALRYMRTVNKNNTVRIAGRVIDIRRRATHGTYAGKRVLIKHLLNGMYRVFDDGECIARAEGERPKRSAPTGPRTPQAYEARQRRMEKKKPKELETDDEDDTFT